MAGNATVRPIHEQIFNYFVSFLLLGGTDPDARILLMRDNPFLLTKCENDLKYSKLEWLVFVHNTAKQNSQNQSLLLTCWHTT